jgi:two-component system cell cycle sensor histidine kinase/response regulator CckA
MEAPAEKNLLRISARTGEAGAAVVEVSDNGAGIPAAVQARIFEPFFTTKPVGVGTGLGLAICHGIVTGSGGSISVSSEPGRGATVTVVLPALAEPGRCAQAAAAA